MDKDNILDEIFNDIYDVVVKTKRWPAILELEDRLNMLHGLKEYFLEKEDFLKCQAIQNKIDKINLKLKND